MRNFTVTGAAVRETARLGELFVSAGSVVFSWRVCIQCKYSHLSLKNVSEREELRDLMLLKGATFREILYRH